MEVLRPDGLRQFYYSTNLLDNIQKSPIVTVLSQNQVHLQKHIEENLTRSVLISKWCPACGAIGVTASHRWMRMLAGRTCTGSR
jgi:hypothetical protein